MNDILILWISAGIFLGIIEIFTGTFYFLALSLAALVVGAYVWLVGDTSITYTQSGIFLIVASVLAYIFPKFFTPNADTDYNNNALDRFVGKSFTLKWTPESYKIAIEWVDYLVDENSVTPAFKKGLKVIMTGHNSSTVLVEVHSK
jgi:membrane protein implicated in regulation of membrane protease activity